MCQIIKDSVVEGLPIPRSRCLETSLDVFMMLKAELEESNVGVLGV